jgi:mannose-6-phosphate isomerase
VFDWNRVGLDGKPRALHLEQALASIDFTDTSPALVSRASAADRGVDVRTLVRHGLFAIDEVRGQGAVVDRRPDGGVGLVAVVSGTVRFTGGGQTVTVGPGGFVVLPAGMRDLTMDAGNDARWLQVSRG